MLRNRLRVSDWQALLGFVLMILFSLGGGLGGMVVLGVAARLAPGWAEATATGVFTVVSLVWVVGPVVAASLDDQLDPRRFELLPVSSTRLAWGLLVAGLIGPGGVATVLVLVGGSLLGFADAVTAVPVIAAATVAVLLVATSARMLVTLLTDLLRSRRTQEVAGLVVLVLLVLPALSSTLFGPGVVPAGALDRVLSALGWLPAGALGRSVWAFAAGRWGIGWLSLGYGVAALVLVAWVYGVALDRLATRPEGRGSARAVRGDTLRPARIPLPAGPVGAVTAKELKYLRRDVRARGQLLGGLIGVVVLATVGSLRLLGSEYAPYLGTMMAGFLVLGLVPNQFGFDGGSFWGYVTLSRDPTEILKGKNLALGGFVLACALVGAVAGAAIGGTPAHLPVAVLAAAAVILLWLAVGNVTSILGPFPLPEGNLFAARGTTGEAFVATMVGLGVAGVLHGPVVVGVGLTVWRSGPGWGTLSALLAVAYAAGVYLVGMRVAGPLLERRVLRVLDTIDRK
jgi:ABC-2 type transport system permease protein